MRRREAAGRPQQGQAARPTFLPPGVEAHGKVFGFSKIPPVWLMNEYSRLLGLFLLLLEGGTAFRRGKGAPVIPRSSEPLECARWPLSAAPHLWILPSTCL